MRHLLALVCATALGAAAHGQAASYTIVGSGCTTGRISKGLGPVPFAVRGVPKLGGSYTITTEGTASYPWGNRRRVLLLTGLSNRSYGGVPLPFDIAKLAPRNDPFCGLLRTSIEVIHFVPVVSDYRAPASVTIAVPNVRALAGGRFYQQVLSIESTTFGPPFLAWSLSAGGQAVAGF